MIKGLFTMRLRRLALALGAAVAASLAIAQQAAAPPPLPSTPGDETPIAPTIAQPPLPPAPPGTLTRSPKGAEAREGAAAASRWQDDLNRLDADLRLRLLSADEPRTSWLAGELDATDIASQVRHYTAARTNAPEERLYQASLAAACLARVRPQLPECAAVDRLADWARRDGENGLPSVLLAERARERGELDSAASYVEQAAGAPRFDDYWSRGALFWWEYLRPLTIDIDPAAKAKAAANYASMRDLSWAPAMRALCVDSGGRSDRMKVACASLGDGLMARGATFALRRAGARLAEVDAADEKSRVAAQSGHARIIEATARCAQSQPDFATELESPAGGVRARGLDAFSAWASAQARDGEVGACARLAK